MKIYSFEKLIVWQKARTLALFVYKITKVFPKDELFGMTSQMRRCSISISSNIAEGSGRQNPKDKARFTEIAYSSALELLNQLIISIDLEYIRRKLFKNKSRNRGNNLYVRFPTQITIERSLKSSESFLLNKKLNFLNFF